jgi:Domain of unknown function (DUF305)
MSSLTRYLIGPAAALFAALLVVGTAFLASHQFPPMTDPDICATPITGIRTEAAFLIDNDLAMRKMMNDMAVRPTGDVDADFVAMMVPHHQGAIDMALAVLRYGRNPQISRLAQEIIVTQRQEIAAMHLALRQHLPPSKIFPLDQPSVQQVGLNSSPLTE